jgi:hypothetical protein
MTLPADVAAAIAMDRADPAIRADLARFLGAALARGPKRRFDMADAIRSAWRDVFPRGQPSAAAWRPLSGPYSGGQRHRRAAAP